MIVRYNINIHGKVENVRILYSTPTHIFDDSVRLAMLRWMYKKGYPANDMTITFKFHLRGVEELSR